MNTVILPDQNAVAEWTADRVARAVESHPTSAIGMAGGSTPRIVHRQLADRGIDWSRAVTWMTDERWVPSDHEDANQRMVRETLIDDVEVRFLAPDTDASSPQEAATKFARILIDESIGDERRSLVMLGMGDDGHTASLFPGSTALEAAEPYVATWVEQHDTWRLTTTFPFLALSAEVLFLVTGANKADMVGAIAAGADVPAAHVTSGSVTWVLDESAAAQLA